MKTIVTLLFSCVAANLFGTAQEVADILIYEGDTLKLYSFPLEHYQGGKLNDPKILFNDTGCGFTASYRNYIATWEVIKGEIYLTQIRNTCYRPTATQASSDLDTHKEGIDLPFANLHNLFPDKFDKGRVKADWVNFELIYPKGALVKYVGPEWGSIYEFEVGLVFAKGVLIKVNEYGKSKKSIFTLEVDSLHWFLFQNLDWELIENKGLEGKKVTVAGFNVNDKGRLVNITIARKINAEVDEEVKRVVGLIPEWDILLRGGKPISLNWNLPIKLDKKFYEAKFGIHSGG